MLLEKTEKTCATNEFSRVPVVYNDTNIICTYCHRDGIQIMPSAYPVRGCKNIKHDHIVILYTRSAATVTVGNANLSRSHLQCIILRCYNCTYTYDKIEGTYSNNNQSHYTTVAAAAVNRSATIFFCEYILNILLATYIV